MLYSGLMQRHPSGEIIPDIAKRYEVSKDKRIYTFYLRDAVWSNGSPVTAYDFEYTWKKNIFPSPSRAVNIFYVIKNVEACIQGKVGIDEVGIRALGKKILEVELEAPIPYFLSLTALMSLSPVNREVDQHIEGWENQAQTFVCNGPFVLKKWRKQDSLLLERNSQYWDKEKINLDRIYIQIIPDTATQFYLYEKGKLDIIGEPFCPIDPDTIKASSLKKEIHSVESARMIGIHLNTDVFPLTNVKIRKALGISINRKEIIDHILQFGEKVATAISGASLALKSEPYFPDGDVEIAQKYLEEGLKELGISREELPPIVIKYQTAKWAERIALVVQNYWMQSLQIPVVLEHAEWATHFSQLLNGDYQAGIIRANPQYYDPIFLLRFFGKKEMAWNLPNWDHPKYCECLEKSEWEVDKEKRKALLQRAEEILMDNMPLIPICFTQAVYLKNPKLTGEYISSLNEVDFKYAYFE